MASLLETSALNNQTSAFFRFNHSPSKARNHVETQLVRPAHGGLIPPAGLDSPLSFDNDGFEFVVADGTNIIRHYGLDRPSLELLLQVILKRLIRAKDFICFFDAPTFYELRDKQSLRHAQAYESLLDRFPDQFIESPGGTEADLYIINEAEARDALIISNDRFKQFHEIFPWTTDHNRFARVKAVRDVLYIQDRRVLMQGDLESLMRDLNSAMTAVLGS